MPSDARRAYDKNCKDIQRLLEIHADVGGDAPGRKWGLEVLNKSAVVLMCAFWEAYCEDLAAEGLAHIVKHAKSADALPELLRKQIARELRDDKHELAPWNLAGDGWRAVLTARLSSLQEERNRRLNTPKAENIDDLFERALGIPRISTYWKWQGMSAEQARTKLDGFVTLRGDIAHRGGAAAGVRKGQVTDFQAHVDRLVGKTGGRVNSAVKRAAGKALY